MKNIEVVAAIGLTLDTLNSVKWLPADEILLDKIAANAVKGLKRASGK